MTACGPERTLLVALHMSAFGGKGDITTGADRRLRMTRLGGSFQIAAVRLNLLFKLVVLFHLKGVEL